MPSLNVGDYMEQCLSSVLNQSLKEIEVICVDAGSTDQTLDIIKKHQENDKRIKLLHSDKKSYGHQVNMGLKEAEGIYISIVETDDYIDENMLKDLYGSSQDNTIDIIKANFYHVYDYDDEIDVRPNTSKKNLTPNEVFTLNEKPLFVEGHPSIWAGIYLREFLEKNNITFLEAPKGGWVDNPFFYETAFKAHKIIYLDKPLYFYRESNPNSSSNDFNDNTLPMRRILDIFDIIEKNKIQDENVLFFFYKRLFIYIEIILENNDNDFDSLDYETCFYIQKVLKKVDDKFVRSELITNFKVLYYKFMSPLLLQRFEEM